jgi:hypothetical protein
MGERDAVHVLPFHDTHDVAYLADDAFLVANMRNWDAANETSNDRVVVYNTTTQSITWEWRFRDHYPDSMDGGHSEDWTHLNDVDVIDDHRLLLSPRNFDQVIVLNRTTGEIELQLGEDGAHDVLYEAHNPDYLRSADGTPTILVADSENDRVVEIDTETEEIRWEYTGPSGDPLQWHRDADLWRNSTSPEEQGAVLTGYFYLPHRTAGSADYDVSGIEEWVTREKLGGKFTKAPILADMKQAQGSFNRFFGARVSSWYVNGTSGSFEGRRIPISSHVRPDGEPRGSNFLFEDGHVEWRNTEEVKVGGTLGSWLVFYKIPVSGLPME